jgi:uncharacterized protein (DUF488 family)
MNVQPSLFTAGYSGHDRESFLNKLRSHRIEAIVDVRRNPVSRKPGFSRRALADSLVSNGLEYWHLRELGVPGDLRDELKRGGCDLAEYLERFRDYLRSQEAAMALLNEWAMRQRCCLLCVESRPEDCHRSVIAEVMKDEFGWQIVNL